MLLLAAEVAEDVHELLAGEVVIAVGGPHEIVGIFYVPPAVETHSDDRLGQHIQAVLGDTYAVDVVAVGGPAHDGALGEVVGVEDDEPSLGDLAEAVSAAPDPLQSLRDGFGGADLTDEVDGTDVDT